MQNHWQKNIATPSQIPATPSKFKKKKKITSLNMMKGTFIKEVNDEIQKKYGASKD